MNRTEIASQSSVPLIELTNREHLPVPKELDAYIDNPLFPALCGQMESAHKALWRMEYSGDKLLLGWNMRFYKGGRSLCRLYPKRGYFSVLVVVGRKEKERVEAALPQMSDAMREIYEATQEGMGQRWLLIDLHAPDALYRDVLELIAIRRASK